MRVIANGAAYECAAAVRTGDSIFLLDENGQEFASFCGIKDLSAYEIEGGEWTEPAPTENEKRDAQIFYTAMMTDTLLEEV